jgi:hypothetical protein
MVAMSGGGKLKARLDKILSNAQNATKVSVGFAEDATYPDGTPVALVAAINEFGAPSRGQPPRPFFRIAINNNANDWGKLLTEQLAATNFDAAKSLGRTGKVMVADVQESIIDLVAPPLSPVTVMLRGMYGKKRSGEITLADVGKAAERVAAGKTNYGASDKPLVWTGQMLKSVISVVE